jgi:prophage regulatory protein
MPNTYNQQAVAAPAPAVLPAMGLSKWAQIAPFVPMSRETWRKMVRAGKAPQPICFSGTYVVYRNEEIHKFLSDPLNYTAEAVASGVVAA